MDGDNNMDNKNKKGNKFNFVSIDENNEIIEEEIETLETDSSNENNGFVENIENTESIMADLEKEKTLKEVVEENLNNNPKTHSAVDNSYSVNKKHHISFETRVAFRIVMILLLFALACYLILEAVNFGKKDKVNYNELAEVNYSVCLNQENHNNCLSEGLDYKDNTRYINADFKYSVDYSKKIEYDLAYHVIGITKVYDKENNTKVLFKNEDILVERTSIRDVSDVINFNTKAEIDYQAYNNKAKEYKAKYGEGADISLELILYLDKENETEDVASLKIPLLEKEFEIKKNELNNLNKQIELDNNVWNEYNSLCAAIASILILLSLLILYRTTRMVLRVVNNRSKYEERLAQILKDYDRQIVNAKGSYELNPKKKIVRVDSFGELLDVHDTLEKPIIYSKINSIKSEFIVEDEDKSYKFVLKDTDV